MADAAENLWNSFMTFPSCLIGFAIAHISPENATNKTVLWTSSDTNIAEVSSDGTVTAGNAEGTVTITARSQDDSSIYDQCEVTVVSNFVAVTGVSVLTQEGGTQLRIYVGETKQLVADVRPSNATNKSVKWSVSQGGNASVTQSGVVTGLKAGSTRVYVETLDGGYEDNIQVVVKKNAVASISLAKSEIVLRVGDTFDITATVVGEDSSVAPSYPGVKWSSTSSGVASVSGVSASGATSVGRITAGSAGEATITVTSTDDEAVAASLTVTVISGGSTPGGNEGVEFDDWNF